MASITPVTAADELAGAFYLDWTEHPQRGPWRRPRGVTRSNALYLFDEASIEIDVAGPLNTVSRCSSQFFGLGFNVGEGVLLGDNLPASMPVHLFFPTPMRYAAATVSVDGAVGQAYLAQCNVRLDNGQWLSVPMRPATVQWAAPGVAATAPLTGAIASSDCAITEMWFDVIDPGNVAQFNRIAIGDLLFLAA